MIHEKLKLERLSHDIWLATWKLEEGPVWAVVAGRTKASEMMREVVMNAQVIPWRSDDLTHIAVGEVLRAVQEAL